MPFVLDNSVATGWYLLSQATAYTRAIARRLEDDRALVPGLWELELVNVMRTACTRQTMTAQAAQQALLHIAELPIDVDRHAAPRSELLGLSLRFGLGAYDASYLELALRRQLPIATQDAGLHAAALASGVGVVA